MIGLALCLMMSSACFAKPHEVFVIDVYDGLEYHFQEKITKAIAHDKKSNLFRITVFNDGPTGRWGSVSAIYNRKQKTLKIHCHLTYRMPDDESGSDLAKMADSTVGWFYQNVNDTKLRKLAVTNNYNYIFGGIDSTITKLGIRGRQLYKKTSYWDLQPNGKSTPAQWIFDERTATYRYPEKKLKTKRTFP